MDRRFMFMRKILKLGMKHQAMELYRVYVNHDPGMTLTYFTAKSTLVAYPRSQVSVYRTIGPQVLKSHQTLNCLNVKPICLRNGSLWGKTLSLSKYFVTVLI